ncbi:MAG: glycosyltransferase family 2 protein [Pirellulales bacterium]
MTLVGIAAAAAVLSAALPAALSLRNLRVFRTAPPPLPAALPQVSVLVPARDEAAAIGGLIDLVLANRGVDLELVILDDDSRDGTREIVAQRAAADPRVRLEAGRPLADDWCGKQHACAQLAALARYDTWVFLDADVRITPDALARGVAFLDASGVDLASGFPRQLTSCAADRLLLPLIHFVLLGFLPLDRSRSDPRPGLAAGCGQLFVTLRGAYARSGGHGAIRRSLHDGLMLPRAYRRAGLRTDIFDATDVATCRMYSGNRQTLTGLAKNATEGMAAPRTIVPFTLLLGCGQVLPVVLVVTGLVTRWQGWPSWAIGAAWLAAILALGMRAMQDRRFGGGPFGWLGHPPGVLVLLAIQWYALLRKGLGLSTNWRGRTLRPQ